MALNTAGLLSPHARGHRAPPGLRSWRPCCGEAGTLSPGPGSAWQPHRHRKLVIFLPPEGGTRRERPLLTLKTDRRRIRARSARLVSLPLPLPRANVRLFERSLRAPMRTSRAGTDAALLLSERPDV